VKKKKGIDWTAQWKLHAPHFHDGFVHIKSIRLKPGPGFGDLSHPTSNLVLDLMTDHVKGRHVLDLGCGSGVLGLCAASEGALSVIGVDIDPEAVKHAIENARINHLEAQFCLPYSLSHVHPDSLLLMNMISSEQKVAWDSLGQFQACFSMMITSGVLVEERESYTEWLRSQGWQPKQIQEKDGWLGFVSYNL
jgi:ribosomal protein L11 methyltransferase